MNQEQIKMGMKINKKINKKIAKNNNKHGNEDISKYNESVNDILATTDVNMMRNKINKWLSDNPEIYANMLNKNALTTQLFNKCLDKLKEKNPNFGFDFTSKKVQYFRPEEFEEKPKEKKGFLRAVTEGAKKIGNKALKTIDSAITTIVDPIQYPNNTVQKSDHKQEIKSPETPKNNSKPAANKKEGNKPEKKEYTTKEIVDVLGNKMGPKFNPDYEQYMNMLVAFRTIIELKSVNQFNKWLDDNPDIFHDNKAKDEIIRKFFNVCFELLKNLGLNPIMDKGNGHISINNDTAAPKINSKPALEAPATPTIPKNKQENKKEENKKTEPKIEPEVKQANKKNELANPKNELKNKKRTDDELFRKYKRMLTPNLFGGNINIDMFMINLSKIINDGNYSNLLEQIRDVDAKYRGTGQKGKDQNGKAIKEIQQLMENNGFLDFNYQFEQFRRAFSDYRKNKLPKGFKKGDRLPFTEQKLRFDLDILIRSNFSLNGPGKIDRLKFINDELSRYGFPTISTAGVNNKTINFANYTEFEKNLRERSKGKIDTNPSNSKTFFSYDIHEIFNIIEKGLNNKLSTEAKNDIESIVKMETSNLINHANISHGASKIQNIIVEIENYLSSRMRNKSKSFKFTESNRYKLKELLSRFLNDKNGQE